MTRLLVSVRDAAEARAALAGGADLIDVKEPLRGPLGAADPATIAAVVREVAGRVPVSAALGELVDWSDVGNALCGVPEPVAGLSYAKLGLAGCARTADWPDRWAAAVEQFPAALAPVAVVYADWESAAAPPPWDVLSVAVRIGCRALLVDTWEKRQGALFDHWPSAALAPFVAALRTAGLLAVLAGSLNRHTIPKALALAPDYLALRGAVCRGSRTGRLDAELVRLAREAVAGSAATTT